MLWISPVMATIPDELWGNLDGIAYMEYYGKANVLRGAQHPEEELWFTLSFDPATGEVYYAFNKESI